MNAPINYERIHQLFNLLHHSGVDHTDYYQRDIDMWVVRYKTHNAFNQSVFMSRKREAVMLADSLRQIRHISEVSAEKIPADLKRQIDADTKAAITDLR